MPLQPLARNAGVVIESVDNTGHRTRQRGAGIGYAVAEGIARANLDGRGVLFAQPHQLVGKRHDEAVEIRSRDVLEVAARHYAVVERGLDDGEVLVERALTVELHFLIYMVVRATDEYARFLDVHVLDELEVLFVGANPAGYLGKFQPQLHASPDRLLVFFAVQEKLAGADKPVFAAELVHQLVNVDDLLDRQRRAGLLTVAKGRVGYPPLVRGIHRHFAVVENHFRHPVVIENAAVKLGLFDVFENVVVLLSLEKPRVLAFMKYVFFHLRLLSHSNLATKSAILSTPFLTSSSDTA